MQPHNNASVFVGSNITCSAEGNPRPEVAIDFQNRGGASEEEARGWSEAQFEIPITTEPGNYTAVCTAGNSAGIAKEERWIEVKSE